MQTSSNYETLKNSYHMPSSISTLKTTLNAQGIDMNSLPEAVRSCIGYSSRIRLQKKDLSKTYPFTGVVAMLGDDGSGQLLMPSYKKKDGEGPSIYTLGKMDVFNPAALRSGKPVVVVTDIIAALKLASYGIEAVSIGTAAPGKYLIPLIDQVLHEGKLIPKIYFHLPEKKGLYLTKELDERGIPCLDISRAVSTGAAFSDFTRSQAVKLSTVVSQIPVNMPAAGKAAA